ncbi:MAG: CHAT domain-containing protein [Candidatus Eisenbacteria bacterium]|uniref:CHAT domain-containing protein n=1 Tax=Eiseniibacteriota bacterium TaxID=2212470 RepID=A0A948RRL5_UNCEI|nr:CHAT domain-containing protein [Candidatus Eisenbacteria bacterium]MBU1948500.1 CHAT domain-containing protein [Candidatus Eisenbacteria bacterium]MBU2689316.1 CHAT domain-containing protein [Candidatus Eisenbacteria bacterium]
MRGGRRLLMLVGLIGLFFPAVLALPLTAPERAAVLARVDSLRLVTTSDAVMAAIDPLIASARAESDSLLLLQLLWREGGICAGKGRARRGEELLREALTLSEAAADTPSTCYILRWLGVAVASQGRGNEARELAERLLALSIAAGDEFYQGMARVGLGWQDLDKGRTQEAVSEFRSASELFVQLGNPGSRALALNGLAVALTRLGSYEEAMTIGRQAAAFAEKIEQEGEQSYMLNAILNNLATLEFSRGDPGAAETHFRQAQALHRRSGNNRAAITPALNLAICQTQLGRYEEAFNGLEVLVQECREQGFSDLSGKVTNQMALVRHLQGRQRDAAELYRRSLALEEALPAKNSVDARIGLARSLAAMDSSAAALAVLEEGARRVEGASNIQLSLGLHSHMGAILYKLGRYDEALDCLLAVNREEERLGLRRFRVGALARSALIYRVLGLPDSAWALVQAAQGLWEADRAVPLNPEWREQRGSYGAMLSNQTAALLLEYPADTPAAQRIRGAFDALQGFKTRTLLERMLGPGEALAETYQNEAAPLATVERLQHETLRPGELLLDAFLGPEGSYLFAVTRTECRVVQLPPETELEEKLRRYYEMVSAPPRSGVPADRELLEDIGARLGAQILCGIEDLVSGSSRILFAPDAALNLLPLWALPPLISSPRIAAGKAFVRIPSATFLTRQRGHPSAEEAPQETPQTVTLLAIAAARTAQGEALPGGVQEVRQLARRYRHVKALVLPGDTPAVSLADLIAHDEVLHLAAHAWVDDQYPWRSTIQFYPEEGAENLHADQIANLELPARLAVLSSCQTAGGRILSLEGVQGLSSAFLSAGVPAVIASLWPVGDRATARLMQHLYAHLADGETVAAALQQAQSAMRRDRRWSAPFFWAGFTVVGDGDVRAKLERRSNVLFYFLLGVSLLMIAAASLIIIGIRRRSRRHPPG